VYIAARQWGDLGLVYVARADGEPAALPAAMRAAIREVDRDLPVARLALTPDVIARVVAPERFNTMLLAIFGGVALVLATVGLYGVMAFLVSQRTREIGIRLALGGRPGQVLAHLLGEGFQLAAIGIVAGLGVALALARAVQTLLFGITPTDPLTYAAIAALLLVVALVASYLPARRALRVDPVQALAP
jgi:ABC-type antimicrobial peptide transport system permease subunit